MKDYKLMRMYGYTVAVQEDGYVHHAYDGKDNTRYPYQLSARGEWVNACGIFTVSQLRRKLKNRTVIWG